MEFGDWLQIIIIVGSVGTMIGYLKTSVYNLAEKIDKLEKKQDKHNSLVERMVKVEYRLDRVEEDR